MKQRGLGVLGGERRKKTLFHVCFADRCPFEQEVRWKNRAGYLFTGDTCCINKSSSAELSEAINSMFAWYRRAKVCYAYLSDIEAREDLGKSQWFKRGWTLQELLAPVHVVFYGGAAWTFLGTKASLKEEIWTATGIPVHFLHEEHEEDGRRDIQTASIAERMFWASSRETTRREDLAYCLLGMFDVNMPLIYGEGDKAFIRLQEEIMRESTDQSLFAWRRHGAKESMRHGLLAASPADFASSSEIVPIRGQTNFFFESKKGGVELDAWKCKASTARFWGDRNYYYKRDFVMLGCHRTRDPVHALAIEVSAQPGTSGSKETLARKSIGLLALLPLEIQDRRSLRRMTFFKTGRSFLPSPGRNVLPDSIVIREPPRELFGYRLADHIIIRVFQDGSRDELLYKPSEFPWVITNISSRNNMASQNMTLISFLFRGPTKGDEFVVYFERRLDDHWRSSLHASISRNRAPQVPLRDLAGNVERRPSWRTEMVSWPSKPFGINLDPRTPRVSATFSVSQKSVKINASQRYLMDSPYILVEITAEDVGSARIRNLILYCALLFVPSAVAFIYWVYWTPLVLPQTTWGDNRGLSIWVALASALVGSLVVFGRLNRGTTQLWSAFAWRSADEVPLHKGLVGVIE